MRWRQTYLCCFVFLGLAAALAGCTRPLVAPTLLSKLPGGGKKEIAERPPDPVPALYIPEPPTARPALIPAAADGAEETFILPVSAPAPVEPKTTAGALQPLIVTAQEPTPVGAPGPSSPARELFEKAQKKYLSMDSSVWRMKRREMVGNQARPEEVMLIKFRREPWSVYLKWLGPEAKGREVIYVKGQHENQVHTLLAAGDVLLLPAGTRFKIAPDSVLAKAKSRYPITDAGMGPLVERFGRLINSFEKGDLKEGVVKYLGPVKRPEFEHEVVGVLQTIPPKADSLFPRGGQRLWFFDPVVQLPTLVLAQDEGGREVEYYCCDRLQYPVHLDDNDFNPEVLWKKK